MCMNIFSLRADRAIYALKILCVPPYRFCSFFCPPNLYLCLFCYVTQNWTAKKSSRLNNQQKNGMLSNKNSVYSNKSTKIGPNRRQLKQVKGSFPLQSPHPDRSHSGLTISRPVTTADHPARDPGSNQHLRRSTKEMDICPPQFIHNSRMLIVGHSKKTSWCRPNSTVRM